MPKMLLSNLSASVKTNLLVALPATRSRTIKLPLLFTFLCLLGMGTLKVNAQSVGDYRSIAAGTWENAGNWQRYTVAAVWGAAPSAPTSADGVITIQHNISINGNKTIDQTILNVGAQIDVFSGTININDGPGADLTLNGTVFWSSGATLNVPVGALINGSIGNFFYGGPTLINNGTIDLPISMEPDPGASTISGIGTIKTLGIRNNAGVTLLGDQTITTLLNFQFGLLYTSANKLILASTATVQNNSGTNWYVVGNLQMNFPVGTSTKTYRVGDALGYRPVDLTVFNSPPTNAAGGVTISTNNPDHPNIANSNIVQNKSVNRYWKVENVGLGFSDLQANFTWDPTEVDATANTGLFKVGRYLGGSWSYPTVLAQTSSSLRVSVNTGTAAEYQVGELACVVNIPDANFKTYLLGNLAINTNNNGEIECAEAAAFNGTMTIDNKNISDLTGLEAFVNLDFLTANNNPYTSINLTANTKLTYLQVSNTPLTALNISQNTLLRTLVMTSVSGVTSLDVSNNPLITFFNGLGTGISTLDFSAQTGLTYFNAGSSPNLNAVNIKNGNNANLTFFYTQSCPQLTCIQVNNPTQMQTSWAANKDAGATFSTICPLCYVNIPDAAFKAALVGNLAINSNGNGEIECAEASAFTGSLNVASKGISNLTGIEAFTSLTSLNCQKNTITTLNLSALTNLTFLDCQQNAITNLNITGLVNLTDLNVAVNSLSSLNLTTNTALTSVQCDNNNITGNLNVSNNTLLTSLACYNNPIASLNLSTNVNLTNLVSFNTQMSSLNLSANNLLTHVEVNDNSLLATLNIPASSALTFLNCSGSNLTSLDVSTATGLTYLDCGNNSLTSLNVNGLAALITLSTPLNQLTSLDVSTNTSLVTLACQGNLITSLDLSNNSALTSIASHSNKLTSLNLKNGNNLNLSGFTANGNLLTCILVDEVAFMNATWSTSKDPGVTFSTNCAIVCTIVLTTSAGDSLILCKEVGQTLGSVNLIVTNGLAPFTFTFGGSYDTTNLAPGNYVYTVTDANGCVASATLNVRLGSCIIPYYRPPFKGATDSLIGSELTQLYKFPGSLADTTFANNIFQFKKDIVTGDTLILVEIIVIAGNYNTVLNLLSTPTYGMRDFVDNGDSTLIRVCPYSRFKK